MHTTARLLAVVLALCVSAPALSSSSSPPIALTGLKPATYLLRRNQRPDVVDEIRALPVEARLRLLTSEGSWLVVNDERTAALKPAVLDQLRQQERYAVKAGAMLALVKESDPRVTPAIRALLNDRDEQLAQIAAERLGERRDDDTVVSTLQALAAEQARSVDVRSGALAGLGRQRTAPALQALLAVVADADAPPALQLAGLVAIEHLGSRWAFEARGDVATGAALRAQAVQALAALSLKGEAEARRVVVIARLRD